MNVLFRIHAVRAISGLQLQVTDAVILRPNLPYEHAIECIPVLEIISSDLKAPQEQQFNDTSIPSVPSVPVVPSEIFTCATLACGIICLPRSYGSLVLQQRSRDTQSQCYDMISNAES